PIVWYIYWPFPSRHQYGRKIVWYFNSIGGSVLRKDGFRSIFKYVLQPLSLPKLNRLLSRPSA
ncbi:MAG: hypothetical protein WCF46_03715, partial [Nitrososphaeraceae archaeon]